MNEEEMYDVNGGWGLSWINKARQTVVSKALELVYTGIRLAVGVSKANVLWAFCSERAAVAGWKGVFYAI